MEKRNEISQKREYVRKHIKKPLIINNMVMLIIIGILIMLYLIAGVHIDSIALFIIFLFGNVYGAVQLILFYRYIYDNIEQFDEKREKLMMF